MSRNRKSPRLGLRLRLYKNGEVHTYHRRVLRRFFSLCRGCRGDRYEIFVKYYPGVINEGIYNTKKEMLSALKAFTNSQELDFIEQYWR